MKQTDDNTTLRTLKDAVSKFVVDRDWKKFHTPRNLAESISIESSELLEVFQWSLQSDESSLMAESSTMRRVEEELADVLIYCMSMSHVLGLDLAQAIFRKLARNERKYPVETYRGVYAKKRCEMSAQVETRGKL